MNSNQIENKKMLIKRHMTSLHQHGCYYAVKDLKIQGTQRRTLCFFHDMTEQANKLISSKKKTKASYLILTSFKCQILKLKNK